MANKSIDLNNVSDKISKDKKRLIALRKEIITNITKGILPSHKLAKKLDKTDYSSRREGVIPIISGGLNISFYSVIQVDLGLYGPTIEYAYNVYTGILENGKPNRYGENPFLERILEESDEDIEDSVSKSIDEFIENML